MDDTQIRLACLDAAVRTAGNPNHIQVARSYYEFVTEGYTGFIPAQTEGQPVITNTTKQKGKK